MAVTESEEVFRVEYMSTKNNVVLVGVLKSKRDLRILLREHWYRIPKRFMPTRPFTYLAFYEPKMPSRGGKQIRYYARVIRHHVVPRVKLLPREAMHPRAQEPYVWLNVGALQKLIPPIKNSHPRRISFGFTTLTRLLRAKTILKLYGVTPGEEMVARALAREGVKAIAQYRVSRSNKGPAKRYCLDFAVICRRGRIAIECDNAKAHAGARKREHDKEKDLWLSRHGWEVIRLTETDILTHLPQAIARITRAIRRRGGVRI